MPSGASTSDRVAVAERELQVGALRRDAVTDTADLELLHVTLGHAGDHVRHQRAGQAVQGLVLTLVVGAGDVENAVLALGDLDRRSDGVARGSPWGPSPWTVRPSMVTSTPAGTVDGELANTRHSFSSVPFDYQT